MQEGLLQSPFLVNPVNGMGYHQQSESYKATINADDDEDHDDGGVVRKVLFINMPRIAVPAALCQDDGPGCWLCSSTSF